MGHVGNNVSDAHPRRIGNRLNDESCMLIIMLSSLLGLPNPAWVSLGNVVHHMGHTRFSILCSGDIVMLSSFELDISKNAFSKRFSTFVAQAHNEYFSRGVSTRFGLQNVET
jgi:hypothetical protein